MYGMLVIFVLSGMVCWTVPCITNWSVLNCKTLRFLTKSVTYVQVDWEEWEHSCEPWEHQINYNNVVFCVFVCLSHLRSPERKFIIPCVFCRSGKLGLVHKFIRHVIQVRKPLEFSPWEYLKPQVSYTSGAILWIPVIFLGTSPVVQVLQ